MKTVSATASLMILIVGSLAIFLAHEHFDRDKADQESRADQRLFAKRGWRKAEIVVYEVPHRVRHDCRTDHGKKKCNCEMAEFLHLYLPCAVDVPEDGFDARAGLLPARATERY